MLLSAHAGQQADLAALAAEPIGRPTVPAFHPAPGESRAIRIVAAAARGEWKTMIAAGRPMFVPVLAATAVHDRSGLLVQAFAIGVGQLDSAKLAPFCLDVPPRAYDRVMARPHGVAVVRTAG